MIETAALVIAILAALGGAILLADLARLRLAGSYLNEPERAQLITGLALVVFAAAFGLARATGDQQETVPVSVAASEQPAQGASKSLARLAAAARLPGLEAEPRKPSRPDKPREPEPAPEPVAEPAPEPTTTTTPTTTPTIPTTTAAPPTTPPAPEPAPAPVPAPEPEPPVSFDDSG